MVGSCVVIDCRLPDGSHNECEETVLITNLSSFVNDANDANLVFFLYVAAIVLLRESENFLALPGIEADLTTRLFIDGSSISIDELSFWSASIFLMELAWNLC